MWDTFPYTSKEVVNLVVTDIDGIAMATAQPKKNNDYITDDDVPILWYFTDTRICHQRTIILDAISEIQELMGDAKINIIWQPINGKKYDTFYKRDVTEVADTLMKIKKVSYTSRNPVRIALATSWYPSGSDKHTKLLSLARLNLGLEVLSYYWFRCRCINISEITMVPRKSSVDSIQEEVTDDERTNLRGYEDKKVKDSNYRDAKRFPMEISYYPARRSREIFRKIIQIYGLEPNWEKACNSRDNFWRIDIPALYTQGKLEILHAPQSGERAYQAMRSRIIAVVQYEEEQAYKAFLPSTYLEDYHWEYLNTQSLDKSRPLDTDIVEYTLAADNDILKRHIPRPQIPRREEGGEREEESRLSRFRSRSRSDNSEKRSAMDRLGPKVDTESLGVKVQSSGFRLVDETVTVGASGETTTEVVVESLFSGDYDSEWEDKEANQSVDQVDLAVDPYPVEDMELSGNLPPRVVTLKPEPSKRARIESVPKDSDQDSVKTVQTSEEDSEDSEVSSSSDEEDRKTRRVSAMIDFLDRYDEAEENRRRKRRKLRKKVEKARKLKSIKKMEQKKK